MCSFFCGVLIDMTFVFAFTDGNIFTQQEHDVARRRTDVDATK